MEGKNVKRGPGREKKAWSREYHAPTERGEHNGTELGGSC